MEGRGLSAFVVLKFNANVPLVTVSAVLSPGSAETPVACPQVSVSGKGVGRHLRRAGRQHDFADIPVRHVLFSVAPDYSES